METIACCGADTHLAILITIRTPVKGSGYIIAHNYLKFAGF